MKIIYSILAFIFCSHLLASEQTSSTSYCERESDGEIWVIRLLYATDDKLVPCYVTLEHKGATTRLASESETAGLCEKVEAEIAALFTSIDYRCSYTLFEENSLPVDKQNNIAAFRKNLELPHYDMDSSDDPWKATRSKLKVDNSNTKNSVRRLFRGFGRFRFGIDSDGPQEGTDTFEDDTKTTNPGPRNH